MDISEFKIGETARTMFGQSYKVEKFIHGTDHKGRPRIVASVCTSDMGNEVIISWGKTKTFIR